MVSQVTRQASEPSVSPVVVLMPDLVQRRRACSEADRYLYVSSQSLWWDIKIMFETPMTMVRGTGAY